MVLRTDLLPVLLPPGKDTALTFTPAHDALNLFRVHTPGLGSVREALVQIDTVFAVKMTPLLFVVCIGISRFHHTRRVTHKRYRGPNADPC